MIETSKDWSIHKKLDEARRVYVIPARASNKIHTQLELYKELMPQNKEIKVIRAEDIRKAVETLKRDQILDPTYEIWTNRDSELHRYLDDLYEEQMDEFFKPIVNPGIWMRDEDNKFQGEYIHWLHNRFSTHSHQYLPDIYVIDKSNLD